MRLAQLSDGTVRTKLFELADTDCKTTAELLAYLGEFDHRRLYAEDGYSSTFAYCLQCLHFSEDMAFKRIRAARVARRFPFFLKAIAEGRVHLTGLVLLRPHLREGNARELLAATAHKTKAEIEKILAASFPQNDLPTVLRALPERRSETSSPGADGTARGSAICSGEPVTELAPEPVATPVETETERHSESFTLPASPTTAFVTTAPTSRLKPLAPRRYALQVTVDQDTHDKLRRLQDLLGHALPSGDVAQILGRAFDALLEKLEKAKCGATDRPRHRAPKPAINPRYIPKSVRREVWVRDGGRCTFVSECGRRCTERKFLEYDHVVAVARGGTATASQVRLLCRTHNQHMAERAFGVEFMRAKLEQRAGRNVNRSP